MFPLHIKKELRRMQAAAEQIAKSQAVFDKWFSKKYPTFDIERLYAMGKPPQTEALAFIMNGEGDVEENIRQVEAFLAVYKDEE